MAGTCKVDDTHRAREISERSRYELVRRDGSIYPAVFEKAWDAAACARGLWPDQEQDEERSGKGWDIQVVGAGR